MTRSGYDSQKKESFEAPAEVNKYVNGNYCLHQYLICG